MESSHGEQTTGGGHSSVPGALPLWYNYNDFLINQPMHFPLPVPSVQMLATPSPSQTSAAGVTPVSTPTVSRAATPAVNRAQTPGKSPHKKVKGVRKERRRPPPEIDLNQERNFPCEQCGATFTNTSNLRSHMRIHSGVRPYVCPECGKSFIQSSNLKAHKRVHTGERPFSCSECGQTFSRSSHLVGHKRTHTGERPYICGICGDSFFTSSHLRNHVRRHTGEKPYKCEYCDEQFSQGLELKVHIRLHTGERPFKCKECEKAFISNRELKAHKKAEHTHPKPYQCEMCERIFRSYSFLAKHRLRCKGKIIKRPKGRPRKWPIDGERPPWKKIPKKPKYRIPAAPTDRVCRSMTRAIRAQLKVEEELRDCMEEETREETIGGEDGGGEQTLVEYLELAKKKNPAIEPVPNQSPPQSNQSESDDDITTLKTAEEKRQLKNSPTSSTSNISNDENRQQKKNALDNLLQLKSEASQLKSTTVSNELRGQVPQTPPMVQLMLDEAVRSGVLNQGRRETAGSSGVIDLSGQGYPGPQQQSPPQQSPPGPRQQLAGSIIRQPHIQPGVPHMNSQPQTVKMGPPPHNFQAQVQGQTHFAPAQQNQGAQSGQSAPAHQQLIKSMLGLPQPSASAFTRLQPHNQQNIMGMQPAANQIVHHSNQFQPVNQFQGHNINIVNQNQEENQEMNQGEVLGGYDDSRTNLALALVGNRRQPYAVDLSNTPNHLSQPPTSHYKP